MTTKKQALLDAEDQGWRALCERFDKLGDSDWERAGVNGDWSPKDLLAHIAAWHALTTDRLEALRSTGTIPPPPDVDAFNADEYDKTKDLSLHDVRAISAAARHRFREELALIIEPIDERLEQIIVVNADGHYEDHFADLDRFLTS